MAAPQDGACARRLDEFANSWRNSSAAALILWAILSASYFFCSAVVICRLRFVARPKAPRRSFNLFVYGRLLASGLFFCGVSEIFLAVPDPTFSPAPNSNPGGIDISTRFLGNKHISAWQLLYAVGNVQLVATKIFVLQRLLEFCAKHSPFAQRNYPRLRIAMWTIYALFSATFIAASTILFVGSLMSTISGSLYVAVNTVISVARLLMFLALAAIFSYGGVLSLSVAQRSLIPLNQSLFAADGRKCDAQALRSHDLMSELVFKLRISTAWNVFWFLVVVVFYLLLAVGAVSMKGSWNNVCDDYQPAVTRMIPILIGPIPTFVMLLGSDVMASMLTLWAMLPSDRHTLTPQLHPDIH